MNDFQPEISVIIPVYGSAPYLKSTIASVETQEFRNFELLIILDRPSPEIEVYTKTLEQKSESIKVARSAKPGIAEALNLGILISSGRFLARIDADDLMRPDRLKLQYAFLKDNPNIVCVGSQVLKINANGDALGISCYPKSPHQISNTLLFRNCIAHPSTMYRKSVAILAGGYQSQFNGAEDYDLWLRMSRLGQIANLSEPLTLYRVWESQTTWGKKLETDYIAARVRSSFYKAMKKEGTLKQDSTSLCARSIDLNRNWYKSSSYFNSALQGFGVHKKRIRSLIDLCKSFVCAPMLFGVISIGFVYRYIYAWFLRAR